MQAFQLHKARFALIQNKPSCVASLAPMPRPIVTNSRRKMIITRNGGKGIETLLATASHTVCFCFLFGLSVEQKTRSNQFQLGCVLVDDLLATLAERKKLISDMGMG